MYNYILWVKCKVNVMLILIYLKKMYSLIKLMSFWLSFWLIDLFLWVKLIVLYWKEFIRIEFLNGILVISFIKYVIMRIFIVRE